MRLQQGFTLLEMIVTILIISLFMSIVPFTFTKLAVFVKERQTKEKLQKIAYGFINYYNLFGTYPVNINDIEYYSNTNNVSQDAWGQNIYYKNNITYKGKTYPAVFISKGKDGILDSNISSSNIILSSEDIYYLVTNGMLRATDRYITSEKLNRVNAAYNVFVQTSTDTTPCKTSNSQQCVINLYENGLIKGTDSYDQWGNLFVVKDTVNGLKSCGPDKICNNSDDIE